MDNATTQPLPADLRPAGFGDSGRMGFRPDRGGEPPAKGGGPSAGQPESLRSDHGRAVCAAGADPSFRMEDAGTWEADPGSDSPLFRCDGCHRPWCPICNGRGDGRKSKAPSLTSYVRGARSRVGPGHRQTSLLDPGQPLAFLGL